jgi:hypothetical protein
MHYLRHLCLFACSGVQYILRCVFAVLFSSCVPYVARFYRLSILDCPFGIFLTLIYMTTHFTGLILTF